MQGSLFEAGRPHINGSRVKQARELSGYTQVRLAEASGVDQTMIAHIEAGTKQPALDLIEAIATFLDMPLSFFAQGDCVALRKGSLLFRSKAIVGKKVITQALEYSRLGLELALRLATYANLIPVRMPEYSDPIEAAREIRAILGLPAGPIKQVIRSIERLGVIVLPLPDIRDCDAFATWTDTLNGRPVIGLATSRPPDRIRLSACHELGHLTLHRLVHAASKQDEEDAYRFAAEFMMPATDIQDDLRSAKITLFRLAELKVKWGASMQALLRRSRELQVLNDRQYRYLMMQISQRGWRSEEPEYRTLVEKPRAIRKISEVAFGYEDSWDRLAKEFNISDKFVNSLLGACEAAPLSARLSVRRDDSRTIPKDNPSKVTSITARLG